MGGVGALRVCDLDSEGLSLRLLGWMETGDGQGDSVDIGCLDDRSVNPSGPGPGLLCCAFSLLLQVVHLGCWLKPE